MVWVAGGNFIMGTDEDNAYDHERPAHKVHVDGFYISETEITNEQFKKFTDATGYKTVAERKPTWEELRYSLPEGTLPIPDSLLVPGSLVFVKPAAPVRLDDYSQWWKFVDGADWKHPEGPRSNIDNRWNHPVVHIAYEDALAYCKWDGSRLPTEAEWEFASHAATETSGAKLVANTFQGAFPVADLKEDGFEGTSPVKTFPANDFGLYDMIGNVWEWTSDFYDVNYFKSIASKVTNNPSGSSKPFDPNEPYAVKRVTKGGSFLCASNYCSNYRPSARQGSSVDSGTSNLGFRVVRN